MKIVKVERSGRNAEGILQDDSVVIIGTWRQGHADASSFTLPSMSIGELRRAVDQSKERVGLTEVKLAIPADPIRKIICVGMNYRDHLTEIKVEEAPNPVLFTRSLDSLVAVGEPVLRPIVSETFDFEGEIAIVIGREGRHVKVEHALDHVFGYTCFMDGSIRAFQKHSLTAGKNFWRSGAMGPWVVTADEVGDADLELTTRLNGQLVQSARSSQMIFGIRQVIAYCSQWTHLQPGDVIATGTPGGIGARREPPLWMKPGDQVQVEIKGVGVLANPVAAGD